MLVLVLLLEESGKVQHAYTPQDGVSLFLKFKTPQAAGGRMACRPVLARKRHVPRGGVATC